MKVLVIDYHMGNLASVARALEECGAEACISRRPADLENVSRFVLPGVGAFGDAMTNLRELGWIEKIHGALEQPGVAMLGICLGMQLLATKGFEGGENAGLGVIPGTVRRIEADAPTTRIPHVGWNEVDALQPDPLFREIPQGTDFYFVHSYHFSPDDSANVIARTDYSGGFASAVRRGNVFGVQFHPEKSSRPGFQLLRNFLNPQLT